MVFPISIIIMCNNILFTFTIFCKPHVLLSQSAGNPELLEWTGRKIGETPRERDREIEIDQQLVLIFIVTLFLNNCHWQYQFVLQVVNLAVFWE